MNRLFITKLIGTILTVGLMALAFWKGSAIPFSDQWPLYEALRTTAAIIFAVVGAWLAIIFPERLRISFGVLPTNEKPVSAKFQAVFAPIVHSSAILAIVLVVGVLAPLLRGFELAIANAAILRSVSYALLTGLTMWQVWTVVLTLVPADDFKAAGDSDNRMNSFSSSLRGLAQQRSETDEESRPE